ncbi:MAG: hypothetical protein WCV84_05615 [Patescibacteria group bacterium]
MGKTFVSRAVGAFLGAQLAESGMPGLRRASTPFSPAQGPLTDEMVRSATRLVMARGKTVDGAETLPDDEEVVLNSPLLMSARVIPLAIAEALRGRRDVLPLEERVLMATQGGQDPRVRVAAYAMALAVQAAFAQTDTEEHDSRRAYVVLRDISNMVREVEDRFPHMRTPSISSWFTKIHAYSLLDQGWEQELGDRLSAWATPWALIPLAIAVFLRHPLRFEAGVQETQIFPTPGPFAFFTGCLIGASVGVEQIPSAWLSAHPKRDEIVAFAQSFTQTFG